MVAAPEQVPGARAAELPGPAAEPVTRARVPVVARSSPCESAAPTTAPGRLPANPYQKVTRRQARRARPAALEARVALEAGVALEARVAPEAAAAAPALVRRPQPEGQAVQAPAVQTVGAQWPLPAQVARGAVARPPVAPAPESVGCSLPEARSRGLLSARCPNGPSRTATRPASPVPSADLPARRPAREARAWPMVIDPRRASPARWAGRQARRRSWSARVA